jgi:LCP family protein required for cell wall assembly
MQYKHFAPERPRPQLPPFRKVLALSVAAIVAVIALGLATASIMEHRSPADVIAGLLIEPPQNHFHKDRIALALFGIDYNYDSKDQPYSAGARTDTIMAVSVNFPTKESPQGSVGILSVPRDMDYVFPSGHEDRINAAYGYGKNPVDGAHQAEKAVADFLGLPKFDRFVTLRINAAKEVIDTIGGIDVVPDETMNYDDHWGHLSIHFKKGVRYHMNGEQAVSYSRFRHDECGDPCRIKRQQQVMRIVLKTLSDNKLADVTHITQLIGVIRRNVITDISDSEALSIANAMRGVDVKALKADQIPYVDDKNLRCCGNVIIADTTKKKALVRKLFIDPLSPIVPLDARTVARFSKSSIHLAVLNGSGVSGLAHRLADVMRKQGFIIDTVGDAPSSDHEATEVHVFSATPVPGEVVLAALPMKTAVVIPEPLAPTPKTASVSDVTIIIGRDYGIASREASAVR